LAAANACTCSTVVVDDVVVDVDVDVDDVVDESKRHDRQSSANVNDCSSSTKSTRVLEDFLLLVLIDRQRPDDLNAIFHECCLNMASNRRYDTVLL